MNVNNRPLGLTTGEPTASGVEWCVSRNKFQFHYPGKSVLKSTTRDARRNPNTTIEGGLALDLGSDGKWVHHDNAVGTAKGILDVSHGINLLDDNGVAQDFEHVNVMVVCMYDKDFVVDTDGTAIDAAGRTDLALGTNGCMCLPMAE